MFGCVTNETCYFRFFLLLVLLIILFFVVGPTFVFELFKIKKQAESLYSI